MHTSRKKIPINAILLQGPNITVKAITAKKSIIASLKLVHELNNDIHACSFLLRNYYPISRW